MAILHHRVSTFVRDIFDSDVPWPWLVVNLLILVPACASRLENSGSRSVWSWLCMVPGVGLLVAVYCLITPSGYSKSKKLDLPGKVITGIVAALLLISIGKILWEEFIG